MKIVLSALNAKYVHSNLAVYDLANYAWKRDVKTIKICEFTINHNLDYIIQNLYEEKADIYAFSCYIWNIYEILTVTRELKKVLPDCEIWLGGPEAGNDALKYLQENSFIEGIIIGEGEVTFYELANTWNSIEQDNKYDKYDKIKGIAFRDNEGSIKTTDSRPLMSMDEVPFVYSDLSKFNNKILYYETSRGCPFSCSYCLSSIDKTVRFRSFNLVKEELDFFLKNKVPQVKFVDRTFNCNTEHALKIWNYIADNDNGVTNFHFEIAADIITDEELRVLKRMRPGLVQLEIGLQSTNLETIHEIHRTMDIDKVKYNIKTIKSFGNIHQHLDLIAGLPYEGYKSFKKSFNDAFFMQPDQLQLGFLKVLKGSYMSVKAKDYDLKYSDFQPYEVLSTKWISYDEIIALKKVEEMVEVYYNSNQFQHVLAYVISFFETPYSFFEAIGDYYDKNQMFGIGFKREARYKALRDFCIYYFGVDNTDNNEVKNKAKNKMINEGGKVLSVGVLDFLLTFDYYLRENAKNRPGFASKDVVNKNEYNTFFKNRGNKSISLDFNGYDSKTAARNMHIEVVNKNALSWIKDMVDDISDNISDSWNYCLFDYEKRNPLSKNAQVIFLKELI